jgi:spore germination cell wall hydrolase CwlJ-like protein
MWHVAAALAPLPLIGLGYASIPGNQIAFRIELALSGNGSAYALPPEAIAAPHEPLPRAAATLFHGQGKGPRADQYLTVITTTYADKQFISASVAGSADPIRTSRGEVIRDTKSDRLNQTVTEIALRGSYKVGSVSFLDFPGQTMQFQPGLANMAPTAETIAYHPTAEGLGFKYKGESQAEFETRERRCLATAIYFEARGEPTRGQIAVGQVILNRVRSPQFPETICGVVYQGQMAPGCQFSFACDGKTDNPKPGAQWDLAQSLSRKITSGQVWLAEVGYSTYYHANYVSPGWVGDMSKIDSIGRHIFYKKRNEKPYVVDASTDSLASDPVSVASITPSATPVSASPALSLGMAPSE